jgi:nucleotide-binding universal stress UspA family protein
MEVTPEIIIPGREGKTLPGQARTQHVFYITATMPASRDPHKGGFMSTHTDLQRYSRAFATPDKILLATDLTDVDYLVPHALAQCQANGASLVIAHAIQPAETASLDAGAVLPADAASLEYEARQILEQMAAEVRAAGVRCEVEIRHGHPRDVLTQLVSQVDAGRVVLGTHGRRNLQRFFLGSVAHEVLKSIQVPCWTVGPQARPFTHGAPHRILHPVSLSSGYQETASLALGFAQFYEAEVTLLHVLPRDVQSKQVAEHLGQWTDFELRRLISEERPLWTTATVSVETGEVVDEILKMADKVQADLIVMGSNPAISFWPIYGDNTVYNVVAQAKCPVLTLRHSEKDRNNLAPSTKSVAMI